MYGHAAPSFRLANVQHQPRAKAVGCMPKLGGSADRNDTDHSTPRPTSQALPARTASIAIVDGPTSHAASYTIAIVDTKHQQIRTAKTTRRIRRRRWVVRFGDADGRP